MIVTDSGKSHALIINTNGHTPISAEIIDMKLLREASYCIEITAPPLIAMHFGNYHTREEAAASLQAFLTAVKDGCLEFTFDSDVNTDTEKL